MMPRLSQGESGELPSDVRSLVEGLISEMEWHLKDCIEKESRERRQDIAALRGEHAAAFQELSSLAKSTARAATPEPAPGAHGGSQALQVDISAQLAAHDRKLQQLEETLVTESSARKALVSEITRSILAEVVASSSEAPKAAPPSVCVGSSSPAQAPVATDVAEHSRMGEGLRQLQEQLGEAERRMKLLQTDVDRNQMDVDASMRRREAHMKDLEHLRQMSEALSASMKEQLQQQQQQQQLQQQQQQQLQQERRQQSPRTPQAEGGGLGSPRAVLGGGSGDVSQKSARSPRAELEADRRQRGSIVNRVSSSEASIITQSHTSSHLELDLFACYTFVGSTWDACLFLGIHPITLGDTILMIVAVLVTSSVQLAFIGIVFHSLIIDPLTQQDLRDLATWRLFTAHSAAHFDPLTQTSLATRVCAGSLELSMAEQQNSLYSSMAQYLPPSLLGASTYEQITGKLLGGRTLCILCIGMWTLLILSELKSTGRFMGMLWKATSSGPTIFDMEHDGIQLNTMNTKRAILLTVSTVFPRILIAISLYVAGCEFLLITVDVTELLLNALALAFIVDVDNMLYDMLVPEIVKAIQEKMKPVRLRGLTKNHGPHRHIDYAAILTFVMLFGSCALFGVLFGSTVVDKVQLASEILCDGNLTFLYTTNKATGAIHISATSALSAQELFEDGTVAYTKAAVLSATNLMDKLNPDSLNKHQVFSGITGSKWTKWMSLQHLYIEEPTPLSVSQIQESTAEEIRDSYLCDDLANTSERMLTAVAALSFTGLDHGISSCTGWKAMCDGDDRMRARTFCPVACGCDDPKAALYDFTGCTSKCAEQRFMNMMILLRSNVECQDVATELLSAPTPDEELDAKLWASCWQSGTKYEPLDMPGGGGKTTVPTVDVGSESVVAVGVCQVRCMRVAGCKHFSVWPDGSCHLQDASATPVHEASATAGPRQCRAAWLTYFLDMESYLRKTGGLESFLQQTDSTNLTQSAMDQGCGWLTTISSETTIDPCCDTGACPFGSLAWLCPATCGVACARAAPMGLPSGPPADLR